MSSFTKPPAKKGFMLEGRTRLPQRDQDLIIELGNSVQSIQQAPGISDALTTSIRNFATVDGIVQNSTTNLEKLIKQLDRMDAQTEGIEKEGLDKVNEVLDKIESLEQNAYCTSSSKSTPENAANLPKNSDKPEVTSPIKLKR